MDTSGDVTKLPLTKETETMETVVEGNKIITSHVVNTKRMRNHDLRVKMADRELREVIRANADLRARFKGTVLDPTTLVCTELSRASGSSLYRFEGCYVAAPVRVEAPLEGSVVNEAKETATCTTVTARFKIVIPFGLDRKNILATEALADVVCMSDELVALIADRMVLASTELSVVSRESYREEIWEVKGTFRVPVNTPVIDSLHHVAAANNGTTYRMANGEVVMKSQSQQLIKENHDPRNSRPGSISWISHRSAPEDFPMTRIFDAPEDFRPGLVRYDMTTGMPDRVTGGAL